MTAIGHNQAPEGSALIARLKDDHADLCAEAESAAHALGLLPDAIDSETDNARATDAVRRMSTAIKTLEEVRKSEKKPYFEAGKEVDGFFNGMKARAENSRSTAENKIGTYLRKKEATERAIREQEQREAEEAAQKAAAEAERLRHEQDTKEHLDKTDEDSVHAAEHEAWEAEQAAEAAAQKANEKPTELARSRTQSGGLSTLSKTVEFKINDIDKIPLDALRPYLARADIEKAIRRFVNTGRRELAGVTINETTKALIR